MLEAMGCVFLLVRLLCDWGFYTMTVKWIQSRPLSLYLPVRSMFVPERTAPAKRTAVPASWEKKIK